MTTRKQGEQRAAEGAPALEAFLATFRAEKLAVSLAGDLIEGINACVECCDRHADADPDGDRVALFWEGADGSREVHTFAGLREQAARFANVLAAHGIGAGDRVAVMLPRIPELMVTALGVWRAGAVYTAMFTAFGPKAIEYRLDRSDARLIVTDPENREKLAEIVVAFVVPHPDFPASPDLVRDLQDYTRSRLSAHAYPREVVFVDELPKTPSGKIRRHVLRERLS